MVVQAEVEWPKHKFLKRIGTVNAIASALPSSPLSKTLPTRRPLLSSRYHLSPHSPCSVYIDGLQAPCFSDFRAHEISLPRVTYEYTFIFIGLSAILLPEPGFKTLCTSLACLACSRPLNMHFSAEWAVVPLRHPEAKVHPACKSYGGLNMFPHSLYNYSGYLVPCSTSAPAGIDFPWFKA